MLLLRESVEKSPYGSELTSGILSWEYEYIHGYIVFTHQSYKVFITADLFPLPYFILGTTI